jgi:hypothetical protein
LIEVAGAEEEVAHFLGRLASDKNTWLAFLNEVYEPRPESERSVVEELYGEVRHATVHYSWVGSEELADRLRDASWLPARLLVDPDSPRVDFEWVQAMSAWQLFEVTRDPDWYAAYKRRHELAGTIASSWMMLAPLALFIYMHERGIDVERLRDTRTEDGDIT